jgi:tetratricopeptide (TPR) repeat protein
LGGLVVSETEDAQRCDFFVSYTGADTAWAEWIAWQLREAGYEVTIQAWHFRPGMNFIVRMRQALDTCKRTLAVVSQAYLDQSTYGSDEWTAAFTHDDPTRSSLLLLVLVEPVTMPRLLRPWIHIDLTDLDADQAAARLVEGVRSGPVEPAEAPAFPSPSRTETGWRPRYPGTHPAVTNLPARNAAFSGRDDLLAELRQRLQEGSAAVVPAQALYGLGGVGKTQLALEYAYRHQADFDLIWWIVAEAPGAIPAGLAELGARLDLVHDTTEVADQEQLAAIVLEELRRRERWLLVFDNIPDREQVASYLPQGDGQVLITSRNRAWGGMARPVRVDTFIRAESVAFLIQRTGLQEETAATALAEELGDLPLALEQAAAYLEQTGLSLGEYLALFRRRREELLKLGEPAAYQATVDTTWQLAIEQVASIRPGGLAGVALLRLCAFLAPEAIPLDLVTQYSQLLPDELAAAADDDLAIQDAVAAPYRYSLVDRDHAGLRIHRLVQAVIRDRLAPEEQRQWAMTALALVHAALPERPDQVEAWPVSARLLPHALAAAENAASVDTAASMRADVLHQTATYLQSRAEYQQAEQILKQAVVIRETVLGDRHPDTLATLETLAHVLLARADEEGARTLHERILAIREAQFGAEHPETAKSLRALAGVLHNEGDLTKARALHERALAIREARLGPDHVDTADSLNYLSNLLYDQGDLAGAQKLRERALAIRERRLGPDHPDTLWTLSNLATVVGDLGDLDSARGLHEHALALREARLGPDHPDIAFGLNYLGHVLRRQGDLKGAREHAERALDINESRLGPRHPETARSLTNLGIILLDQGDLDGARAYFERALSSDEAHNPNNLQTATSLNNLAMVLVS